MNNRRVKTNLIFIVVAAVVLVLISGFQYYYSRHLLGIELEEDTERELAQKEAFLDSYRSMCENSLVNHIWDLEKWLSISAGYTYMHGTKTMEIVKRTPNRNTLHWAYVQLVFNPNFLTARF